VFRRYNLAVWPAQWVLVVAGLTAVVLALRERGSASRWVSVILAVMWFWMAAAYHLSFFTRINPAAIAFAAAFAVQGALFAWVAFRTPIVTYWPRSSVARIIGAALIVYAIVVYPLLGYALGHRYPATPTFGVPCPTTIFTLGLVVWAGRTLPGRLLVVPVAWSVVATSAAVSLGMMEDFGLSAAAIATALMVGVRRRPSRARLYPTRA
jgi:hypothetical protein